MKASICISTYNSEKTIRKTLDSVLAQTFDDYEVVIVDDYSTDDTLNIITNEYCAKDKRFKLFVNTTDSRWPYIDAFNKSYEYASGELLCRLDHDDILLPDYLEYVVNYMNSHTDVDGCSVRLIFYDKSDFDNIDLNNLDESKFEPNYIDNYHKWIKDFNYCPPAIFHLAGYCDDVYVFHNPGSCIRRSFYEIHKPKCMTYVAGDSIFWLQVMASGGKIVVLDDCKIVYTGRNYSSNWSYRREKVEDNIYYQVSNNLQGYYIAYLEYFAMTLYPDDFMLYPGSPLKNLTEVMRNTAAYFKDCLIKENAYDKVLEKFRL